MTPALHDLPIFDDQDEIGALNRREPMGNHYGRAPLQQLIKALLDQRLAFRVQI